MNWEYHTALLGEGRSISEMRAELNKFGQAGWELVNIVAEQVGAPGQPWLIAFFKRPLSN